MRDILKQIDFSSIEDNDNVADIETIINEYRIKINESNLLQAESPRRHSEANFDSKLWIFYNSNTDKYSYIDFKEVHDLLKLNLISSDDYNILKCWYVSLITKDSIEPSTVSRVYSSLLDTYIKTQGFKKEKIITKQGNELQTFIDLSNKHAKREKIRALTSYANFLDEIGYIKEGFDILCHTAFNQKYKQETGIRELPRSSSIFTFDFCVKDFFNNSSDDLLKKIYYPVLIWWKVTNVIPIRPSELATTMGRDCLLEEDGHYFLKLKRVKLKRTKHTIHKGRLPVLNKIAISKEIYDVIKKYIEITDFTKSETLFSWDALVQLKDEYMYERLYDDFKEFLPQFKREGEKLNWMIFGESTFRALLDSFYKNIVENQYGYYFEQGQKLTPGDTRHLAFCNLALQGLSPVEIALLGGHTTLSMQESYVNHIQYFIDNEVLSYLSDRTTNVNTKKLFKRLLTIVKSKTPAYKLDIDFSLYDKDDYGIGYCLADEKKGDVCDDVPHCVFCSKWWCEPTNESYIQAKKWILESEISPLAKQIEIESEFFMNIIREAKNVNINGLAEIDKLEDERIRAQALKVKSKVDKLAFLKASLIEEKLNENENNTVIITGEEPLIDKKDNIRTLKR